MLTSIKGKQYEKIYLNEDNTAFVSKKGLAALIKKEKNKKKIDLAPLLTIVKENKHAFSYFAGTLGFIIVVFMLCSCCLAIRYRDTFLKCCTGCYNLFRSSNENSKQHTLGSDSKKVNLPPSYEDQQEPLTSIGTVRMESGEDDINKYTPNRTRYPNIPALTY